MTHSILRTGTICALTKQPAQKLRAATPCLQRKICARNDLVNGVSFYDALGNRVETDTWSSGPGLVQTRTSYDNAQGWADLTTSNVVETRYFYDPNGSLVARIDAGVGQRQILTDREDSVRDVTDTSGTVLDHVEYAAFGGVASETGASYGGSILYTGQFGDRVAGIYVMANRDYMATVRVWMQTDPFGFSAGQSNLYAYVGNDPIDYTDPLGLWRLNFNFGVRLPVLTFWSFGAAKGWLPAVPILPPRFWAGGGYFFGQISIGTGGFGFSFGTGIGFGDPWFTSWTFDSFGVKQPQGSWGLFGYGQVKLCPYCGGAGSVSINIPGIFNPALAPPANTWPALPPNPLIPPLAPVIGKNMAAAGFPPWMVRFLSNFNVSSGISSPTNAAVGGFLYQWF